LTKQSSATTSEGGTADAVIRSRHGGSAIVLLGLAAPATLFLTFWTTAPLPVLGVIVILWAAGLGLLTRTTVGLWLGRLGATALLLTGAYVAWNEITWFFTLEGMWRNANLVVFGVLTALLLAASIGVWVALRPRAGGR